MSTKGKTFEFRRKAADPVRYVVTATYTITKEQARLAFEEYISKHLVIATKPREIKIRFEEWFPATRYPEPRRSDDEADSDTA